MNNVEWLKDLMSQQYPKVPLEESFSPKWCCMKRGKVLYNPKQLLVAHPIEFKLFVFEMLYNKLLR
jgi:hypothetical protein